VVGFKYYKYSKVSYSSNLPICGSGIGGFSLFTRAVSLQTLELPGFVSWLQQLMGTLINYPTVQTLN